MVQKLNDINAESRSEMVCPSCYNVGLAAAETEATDTDSTEQAIIEGTRCTEEGCKFHPDSSGPDTIPASKIEKQYAGKSREFSLPDVSFKHRRAIASLTIIGALAVLFVFGGGGSVDPAAASNVSVNETDPSFEAVETIDGWTIYESNGSYMVSGKIDSKITYLNASGDLVSSPWIFDTEQAARNAIFAWQARDDQLEDNPQPNKTADDPIDDAAIGIYEHNGTYVVATERNGSVVYLTEELGLRDEPYHFDSKEEATNHYLEYISENGPYVGPNGESISSTTESEVSDDIEGWIGDEESPGGDDQQTSPTDDSGSDTSDTDSGPNTPDYTGGEDSWSNDGGSSPSDNDDDSDTSGDGTGDGTDGNSTDGTDGELSEPPAEEAPSHSVQGTYKNSDGESVEGVTVHLHSEPRTTTTDSEGHFSFENVSAGTHELYADPAGSELNATSPLEFKMGENGTMTPVENSDAALFIENNNGSIAGNAVTLLSQPARDITVSGSGSNISANVTFQQQENAKDVSVKLTPIDSRVTKERTFTGDTLTTPFEINGTATPEDGKLILEGVPVTSDDQLSGTVDDTTKRPIFDGNLPPADVSVTLDGTKEVLGRYLTGGTLRDGSLPSVADEHNGNLGPQDVKLYLAPQVQYLFKSNAKAATSMNGITCLRTSEDTTTEECRNAHQGSFSDRSQTVTTEAEYTVDWSVSATAGSFYGTWGDAIHTGSGEAEAALMKCSAGGSCEVVEDISVTNTNAGWSADGDRSELPEPYSTTRNSGNQFTGELAPGTYYKVNGTLSGDGSFTSKVEITRKRSPNSISITGGGINTTRSVHDATSVSAVPPSGQTMQLTDQVNGSLESIADIDESGEWTSNYSVDLTLDDVDALNNITVSADQGQVAYRTVWTSANGTKNVDVTSNGQSFCRVGELTEGLDCDIPTAVVEESLTPQQPLKIEAAGEPLDYTIDYTVQVGPPSVRAAVNNEEYLYPSQSVSRGPLGPNSTTQAELFSLSQGENTLEIETGSIDGMQPETRAIIRYLGGVAPTKDPVITVRNRNGTHTKSVPSSLLTQDETLKEEASLSLPADWFVEGDNQVIVKAAEESEVRIQVSATGLKKQTETATPASG